MALRRNSGVQETPTYDIDNEPGTLTIKLYHGGVLLHSPKVRYVGGGVDYYDYVNGYLLGLTDLKTYVSECRPLCDKEKCKFYHKFRDDMDKGCRLLSKETDLKALVRFCRIGKVVEIFVQHDDLENMLRAEAANGEIRQDNVGDEEEEQDSVGLSRCSLGFAYLERSDSYNGDDSDSVDESEGLVNDEYRMDDNVLFEMNVDEGAEESHSFNHVEFFSNNVHEQMEETESNNDCVGSDDEGFHSGKESSEEDESTLDIYPKYNPKTDGMHPKFKIGMLFSCREELKRAINTQSIKDTRDVKYIRNEKTRIRK
ncbi:hypothetical protein LIER_19995 [Lithospermum erythrorhizon]|uniref:PB1-like domain-containing protein n=1 Tax=Lithospermum erythrorhizon TaxID=34254 RepID=A0AAV3QJS8_LITER